VSCLTYLNFTKINKAIKFHGEYKYTYFITITTNYKEHNIEEIFKKLKNYLHGHDRKSHIISVKERTTISKGLHYHILYFTDKKLDYSRIHKRMPSHSDINIQLVKKSEIDIKNVIKYMNKTKKCHKSKLKIMKAQISIFDFKANPKIIIKSESVEQSSSQPITKTLKVIEKVSIFDFKIN